MARNKFKNFDLKSSVDTVQIKTMQQSAVSKTDAPYIDSEYETFNSDGSTKAYNYIINPNAQIGYDSYSITQQGKAMEDILIQMQIENFNFNRVDLRFDFFNATYDKLFKLNRMFLSVYRSQHCRGRVSNYMSYDGERYDPLTCRVSSSRYQIECYNKRAQEPKGPVETRLECRSMKLKDGTSIVDVANQWKKEILDVPDGFDKFIEKADKAIYEMMLTDSKNGIKPNPEVFLSKIRDYVYTSQQVANVYRMMGGYANPEAAARRYRRNYHLDVVTKRDLSDYCRTLAAAIDGYLDG